MIETSVTVKAHPNIAFIKYWGNKDDVLRIPSNGSISMNLGDISTLTTVEIDPSLRSDELVVNGITTEHNTSMRIRDFLSHIRKLSNHKEYARISSHNDFPSGSGIASSASGFAALALAGSTAYGLHLTEIELSCLARRGSGSACRSIPTGYVEWQPGTTDEDSFAFSIGDPDYWDLVDIIAIVDPSHKKTGSTQGHHIAKSSPLQNSRVEDAPRRIHVCRTAIQERDFSTFANIVEQDCLLMHAVMMTSDPNLIYWKPPTLELITKVVELRQQGLPVCYTIDAGPNVHILTLRQYRHTVEDEFNKMECVRTCLVSGSGEGAYITS